MKTKVKKVEFLPLQILIIMDGVVRQFPWDTRLRLFSRILSCTVYSRIINNNNFPSR